MTKREHIEIKRDTDLAEIDDELDAAIGELESTNTRIGGLLESIDKGEESLEEKTDEDATAAAQTSDDAEH